MSNQKVTKAQLAEKLATLQQELEAAEQARSEWEIQFHKLVEVCPDGVFLETLDGRVLTCNRAACEMYGYSQEEMASLTAADLVPEHIARTFPDIIAEELSSGGVFVEAAGKRKDGAVFPTEVAIRLLSVGSEKRALVYVHNTSGHKYTQSALQESDIRFRSIIEGLEDGYYETDLNGNLTFFNTALGRIVGYPPGELAGMNYRQYFAGPECIRRVFETFNAVYRTGTPARQFNCEVIRKDGTCRTAEMSCSLIRNDHGAPSGFRGIVRDVTERKQAEEKLQFQALLLDQIQDLITATDLEGRITYVNAAECRAMQRSREELLGQSVEIYGEDPARGATQKEIIETTRSKGAWRGEVVNYARDGSEIIMETHTWLMRDEYGRPTGMCGVTRDITQRRQLEREKREMEARIQQKQKFESLGVLAGGIAHDFNNLLMGILGNAELAIADIADPPAAIGHLREVEAAARRAADLCRQMLAYAGRGGFAKESVDLTQLVKEMEQPLDASISKHITLRCSLEAELPAIQADPAQVSQVVMNLVTNASEAIGDDGGVITIRTGTVICDREDLKHALIGADNPPGRYVYIEVSDTGCGMSQETLRRVFEPFFTTKAEGRGLGLPAVLGTVQSNCGAVQLHSEPGQGTTFRVLFPASEPRAQARLLSEAHRSDALSETGTILVVDDEEAVRKFVQQRLERQGFHVITAADGLEGVNAFRDHANELVAVILDCTMPRMTGEETLREMRQIRQDIPVLLSSGYDEQETMEALKEKGAAGFIQKPYQGHELIQKLRGILESRIGSD